MRKVTITLIAILSVAKFQLFAQAPDTGVKEKMKAFSAWAGRWQGEGSMLMRGEWKKSSVDEKIESKLDGTLVVMEGVGKAPDATGQESVVHHAFGVLNYDYVSAQYKLRTFLKDGKSGDPWFNVTGENTFQWGFDIPNGGKSRYTITIDPNQKNWNEVGEYSRDGGTTWSKFFEMNLKKVE